MTDLTDAPPAHQHPQQRRRGCVEVADNLPGPVAVRDSKDRPGPVLTFHPAGWAAFVSGLKHDSLER